MNLPEGFKSLKDNEPPLWEDVVLLTEDNRRIIGYYNGNTSGEDEFRITNNDNLVTNVVGWMPTF